MAVWFASARPRTGRFSSFAGIKTSDLLLWATAGLGITMAYYSSHKACEEKDDGINRLPDDILCNIVSRLTVIEASRTSVLSKRWRKIRTLHPLLRIDCLCTRDISKDHHDHVSYGDKQRFLKAVSQCLELYSGRKLKAFLVHCCFLKHYCFLNDHACHVVRWIRAIARLDVEQLYLGHFCPMSDGLVLDRAFTFSFKLIDGLSKLLSLDLTFCYVETSFASQCNSLMWLILRGVPLPRQELSDILLSCPNLTNLEMKYCQLPQNLRISGPNLKLEVLELFNCYDVQKLELSDLNLVTINIYFRTDVEILLSSVPKLERLHLITRGMHYYVGDFPRDLLQLKYLLIQTGIQIRLLPPIFRVFGNVEVLYLFTRGNPSQEASQEVDLWNFAPVLSACPRLEEFYLTVGGVTRSKDERKVKWPTLQHKRFKHMELSGFCGTQNELEFAKFILRCSQVLESLVLRSSYRRCNGESYCLEGEEVLKQFDAQLVRAELQGHALSKFAKVELY